MIKPDYQLADLANAESRYKNVHLESRQRELVNFLGTFFCHRLGMTEIACRGYWVLAVAAWQQEKKRAVASLEAKTPADRLLAAREIAEHFRILVSRALLDSHDQKRLDDAIGEGMVEYQRLFARP